MNEPDALQKAISWAGTARELAKRCRVSETAVSLWRKTGIPPRRAIQIERLSGGELKATELCANNQESEDEVA